MNGKKNDEDQIMEILSEKSEPVHPDLSPGFRERLRKNAVRALYDPQTSDDDDEEFWAELDSHKEEDTEAYDRFTAEAQGSDEPAVLREEDTEAHPEETAEEEEEVYGTAAKTAGSHQADTNNHKIVRLSPQWKALLSFAAVFVFLICGTLLTRGSLRNPVINQNIPEGQTIVTEAPNGTDINETDITDTGKVKNPDSRDEELAGFVWDMWLFIKTSLPYLGAAAALALIVLIIRKQKKANQ